MEQPKDITFFDRYLDLSNGVRRAGYYMFMNYADKAVSINILDHPQIDKANVLLSFGKMAYHKERIKGKKKHPIESVFLGRVITFKSMLERKGFYKPD